MSGLHWYKCEPMTVTNSISGPYISSSPQQVKCHHADTGHCSVNLNTVASSTFNTPHVNKEIWSSSFLFFHFSLRSILISISCTAAISAYGVSLTAAVGVYSLQFTVYNSAVACMRKQCWCAMCWAETPKPVKSVRGGRKCFEHCNIIPTYAPRQTGYCKTWQNYYDIKLYLLQTIPNTF